jgi:trehalose/maltose hydrolase-like predicted phosphorylase
VISQFEGFEWLKPFDGRGFAERHSNGRVDWMLEARGDTADAYQVSKQADVMMLLYLLRPDQLLVLIRTMGYEIGIEELQRTASFYLDRITHESSLSQVVCAGALASRGGAASRCHGRHAGRIAAPLSRAAPGGRHAGSCAGAAAGFVAGAHAPAASQLLPGAGLERG